MTPSSRTPAAWMTAVSGCSAGMPASSSATAARSATSQAATVTVAPSASRSAQSSATPPADRPRRLVRIRCRTPCTVTRCRLMSWPRVPVAPVISTVPSPSNGAAGGSARAGTRVSRDPAATPERITTCGSSVPTAATRAAAQPATSSTSTSTNRSGFSDWAERSRPMTAAPARSVRSASVALATAPRVSTTSRESAYRSSARNCWSMARTRWVTSATARGTSADAGGSSNGTTSTPGASAPSSSAAARAVRSGYAATAVPVAATASVRPAASPTTAQPAVDGPAGRASGAHSIRNSDSVPPPPATRSWSAETGRSTREPTEMIGAPVTSASSRETLSVPVCETRTRAAAAPAACRATSFQENGSRP
ncbi:hypothetical protein C5N14_31080 [Micromonospora sp. MW-13]|nr:hypothetical protein C5N14_31080 [Micromonospora sp. MW-13]